MGRRRFIPSLLSVLLPVMAALNPQSLVQHLLILMCLLQQNSRKWMRHRTAIAFSCGWLWLVVVVGIVCLAVGAVVGILSQKVSKKK